MHRLVTLLLKSLAITVGSALVAVGTNALRPGGIPLVTDVPYDIFAECKDVEAEAVTATADEIKDNIAGIVLYVDARPAEQFAEEHIEGAINIPYSPLFGAGPGGIEKVKTEADKRNASTIAVYGAYTDPSDPQTEIDFGKPLAAQLTEAGIAGVRHVEGGLKALKKMNLHTVQSR
jgi:rhodanese-related sulfurtransferase